MRVIVPFATKSPMLTPVRIALSQDGWEAEYHHCSKEDDYYNLVVSCWNAKETFCIVEHDIVVWPGALQELESCPEFWCTRPYYCSVGWIIDGLGCTKFSKELLERYPSLVNEPFPSCCAHTKNWCGLDRVINHRMIEMGMKPHVHLPGVSNLNDRWS
jgi:hypothetical protein